MTGAPASTSRTYADHVLDYAQAGWPCILPVPAAEKYPPPVGFTGAEGRDTDPMQLVIWTGTHPSHSIALRMPDGVIGIDVDEYAKGETTKHGLATLRSCEERWGQLPATWSSTARGTSAGPGPSRIMFFRVPPQRYATKLGPDVEVIQRHHRYAVVAPSPHASVGHPYAWYDPQGHQSPLPPKPEELTELPPAWVAGLAEGATEAAAASADVASGQALLEQLLADLRPECADLTSARLRAIDETQRSDAGSRHDTMTERVHHLVQLAAAGHTGSGVAFEQLRDLWASLTAGEDREDEFERMLLTSARKAVTVVGAHQVPRDPCTMIQGFEVPSPAPSDDRPGAEIPDGIEPSRWWSVREVIGAHAFDPQADTDQTLAQAVLERTWPVLRYAYDAGAWVLRVPERWEVRSELAPFAVAEVASLMPQGSPGAEAGSPDKARAQRRARLLSASGGGAVASKMKALVAGGTHPCSLELGRLDSEPEVLWAGGVPWDLRRSVDGLVVAPIDPATPHLQSAAVTPEIRPTPLWDAFIEAVWPDPELRRWAVRVLSVSLTGYPDRALPILLGETGRGKTQVITLLMSVLGSYAHAANPKLLSATSNAHDSIVYALKGRRLSFIDEGPREAKSGQERLKQLTGGGELTANQMNQNPITFRPTHTLVLTANEEPMLTDPAVRARVRLIPCEGDPALVASTRAAIGSTKGPAWRQEAPGVLAAMVRETAHWLADTSSASTAAAPEGIRYLAEDLAVEQDPVRTWLEEETEPYEPGTPSRSLYQAFHASCRQSGLRPDAIPNETRWGRQLTRLGYPSTHSRQGKTRHLRIRATGWVGDGFTGSGDGFVTGSQTNPSQVNPQVTAQLSPSVTGVTGFDTSLTHTRPHTHAGEPTESTQNPVTPVTTRHGGEPPSGSVSEPVEYDPGRPTGPANVDDRPSPRGKNPDLEWRTEHAADLASGTQVLTPAKQRAAEKRVKARLEAIAAAAGPSIAMPALVTRDGEVRSVALADADGLLATLDELTVDVEHTGYPIGHADYALRTVQLGTEQFAFVLDADDPEHADVVRRHMARAAKLHAHSATADLVPLAVAGLVDAEDAWQRMHDTVIPAKLADPSSTGSDPGLKELAEAVLREHATSPAADDARGSLFKAGKWLTKIAPTTAIERSGWAQVDASSSTMLRYAASDVLDDAALARVLPQPPSAILERERMAQRMTARVAHHGVRIDGEHTDRMLEQQRQALAEAGNRLQAFGVENPGSDQQVGAAATQLGAHLPRTSTGRASVAKGALDQYARLDGPLGDFVRARLDYQKAETAIGLFLEPYHQLVHRGDGRARPTVYTLAADTGRMSCVRPNLQQVPREGGFRSCLTADPGELLVSADFASVEIRVMAALSQDPSLMQMLDQGVDLHGVIAKQVFGPDASKADRYMVKRGVFGWAYGGGVPTLARQVGASEQTMGAVVDTLASIAPTYVQWTVNTKEAVKAGHTQFPTYAGRIVHLPRSFPHKAPNYCIQGTARELLIDALARWEQTPWGGNVLLPVHDEIVVRVDEADAEAATAALVDAMTTTLHGVQIKAEASSPSFAWADAS